VVNHYTEIAGLPRRLYKSTLDKDLLPMFNLLDFPVVFGLLTLVVMGLAVVIGEFLPGRAKRLEGFRDDFGTVLAASLTLLGLIIGFTFSMATTRYDQRKNLEEEEANAIGTEYVRLDLMGGSEAAQARSLLRDYLELRIRYYGIRNTEVSTLKNVDDDIAQIQNKMWSVVSGVAQSRQAPVMLLVVTGMNDVLNSQGYTQAAWWNRIPTAAWVLMMLIGFSCNLLIGFGAHKRSPIMLILPLLVAISFLLIADIDSPRGGLIRVKPINLITLADSLKSGQ
jgi:hypothetical protein